MGQCEFAIHNYPPATIEIVMYPDPTIEERRWHSQAGRRTLQQLEAVPHQLQACLQIIDAKYGVILV